MLHWYTVALRVSKNYSQVANLKRSKFRIVHLLLLQPVKHCNMRSETVKTAIDHKDISQRCAFCA